MAKTQKRNYTQKIRKNKKTKKKITPGIIVDYSYNRQHDRFIMNYMINEPKSGILVLLPTVKLTDDLRSQLYKYVHDHGHIKAVKKIKLDFDNVVKLINQFYIHQNKKFNILEIKRKVMLDVSWEPHKKKKVFVIVWKKRTRTDFRAFEKKINNFIMRYELNKVVDTEITDFMKYKKKMNVSGKNKSYSVKMKNPKELDISDYQNGGGHKSSVLPSELEIVSANEYPLGVENKSEEEITLNFLTNILTDKLYICSTHNYSETITMGKLLFSKNIVKNL